MSPAIKGLIMANTLVFLLGQIAGERQFFSLFGLVPQKVLAERWLWQPLTHLFVHGGFMHLLFNLFALWMFGMPVEAQWGTREFLKYYLLCGLGAAALTIGLSPHSTVPVIGASGPVYGLLVAFAMLYPDAVVYLYFLIPISARQMAILFGLIEFFAGTAETTPNIARFAHLGGMVTGYVYLRWWWVLRTQAKSAWRGALEGLEPRLPRRRAALKGGRAAEPEEAGESMEEIDRILDKILADGMESLTEEEREIMKRYSKHSAPPRGGE